MSLTYHIATFGCQMNDSDSEMMSGILAAKGWRPAAEETAADVVIYNTCVVRDHAEQRAMARLEQLRAFKRRRPDAILAVVGCMAQKEAERLTEALPHVDLVVGPRAIAMLSALLDRALEGRRPQVCTDILDDPYPDDVAPVRRNRLKALVNIVFGCNRGCTYCIVPRVRGREVSRSPDEIVDEVRGLAGEGYREITLVGQNVNAYRWDAEAKRIDFGGLLRRVSEAAGPECWIRYITSHPRDCNEAHLAAVAECANVCENFHLPIQAGSDAVLRNMRRGYTAQRYLDLVERIREIVPDTTLTTDLMVGFPGETEEDYRATLDLAHAVRFDAAYMYLYSARPDTPATERFGDDVALDVKKRRLAELIELQEGIGLEINRAMVGRRERVLVEDVAPRGEGDLLARTRGDKMVVVPGPAERIGTFIDVEIRDATGHTLLAIPLS